VAVCESCGVTFELGATPAEVKTSRVLCGRCYARRQTEKAKAKTAGATASAGLATGASTVIMARPAPVAPPPPKAAPTKPPRTATSDTAAPRVTAADAPGAGANASNHSNHATAGHATAGHATTHAGTGTHAHGHGHGHGSRHGPKRDDSESPLHKGPPPLLDKTTKIGLIIALVVLGLGAGAFFIVRGIKNDEKRADDEVKSRQQQLLTAMKGLDLATLDGAQRAIGVSDGSKETWVGTEIAGEVNSIRAKAGAFIQSEQEKRDYFDNLATLEAAARDPGSKSAQELRDISRRAETLALTAQGYGADAVTRITGLRNQLQQSIGLRVKTEAVQFADQNATTDPRGAMLKLSTAEDDIRRMWEQAHKDKNDTQKTLLESYLGELIKRTDDIATVFFTDAEVAKSPWKDLLLSDAATEWKAANVKGFSYKVENGQLIVIGPDESAKARAVLSIGDKQKWRDFVIDGEFVLESGVFTLAFRLGATPNANTDTFEVRTEENGIEAGKPYAFTYKVVGSNAEMVWKDDVLPKSDRLLSWYANRSGAFGLVIEKGTKLRFTRLRIRELR
jgi:hypothetical protein